MRRKRERARMQAPHHHPPVHRRKGLSEDREFNNERQQQKEQGRVGEKPWNWLERGDIARPRSSHSWVGWRERELEWLQTNQTRLRRTPRQRDACRDFSSRVRVSWGRGSGKP